MDQPEFNLNTKYGEVHVIFNSKEQAHVTSGVEPVFYRGIPIRFYLDLIGPRFEDPPWDSKQRNHIVGFTRRDKELGEHPSHTAMNAIIQACHEAVLAFVTENPDELRRAELWKLNDEKERIHNKILAKEQELADLERKETYLDEQIGALQLDSWLSK